VRIEHVALWTKDLEKSRAFYQTYFDCAAGKKYRNPKTGFESYFLSFDSGSRLELMHMGRIPTNRNSVEEQYIGLIHLALSVGSEDEVLAITEKLRRDGFPIVGEPRTTGDGYFESCVLDPDENRIEITV
jgi:lactoylglutathione lyase